MKPTKERIGAALERIAREITELEIGHDADVGACNVERGLECNCGADAHNKKVNELKDEILIIASTYRATRKPAAIIGRMIGYIIAASLLVLSLGGLVCAAKMAIRMVAG